MLNVGILVFDNVEILDFSGPYQVFSTATRVHARMTGNANLFQPFLVAADMRPILARGGMQVLPEQVLDASSAIDILIVPGGDVSAVLHNADVIERIRAQATVANLTASVCTGSFLLAKTGLLDGLQVTTHWEDQDDLQASFPTVSVVRDVPWVDCGKVITSAGISAGIDMSLYLVQRLAGLQLANATARQMEYRWVSDATADNVNATSAGVLSAA